MKDFTHWEKKFKELPSQYISIQKSKNQNMMNIEYSFGPYGKAIIPVEEKVVEKLYKEISDRFKFNFHVSLCCFVTNGNNVDKVREEFGPIFDSYLETGNIDQIRTFVSNYIPDFELGKAYDFKNLRACEVTGVHDYCFVSQISKTEKVIEDLDKLRDNNQPFYGGSHVKLNKYWFYEFSTDVNCSGRKGNLIIFKNLTLCPADPIESFIIKQYREYEDKNDCMFRNLERNGKDDKVKKLCQNKLRSIIKNLSNEFTYYI